MILDNVVLNITNDKVVPVIDASENYNFTMMGVSEDNWVIDISYTLASFLCFKLFFLKRK